jgi:hypothetical protein
MGRREHRKALFGEGTIGHQGRSPQPASALWWVAPDSSSRRISKTPGGSRLFPGRRCPIVPKSANREITNQIRMIRASGKN